MPYYFEASGKAIPQGSKIPFRTRDGRLGVRDSNTNALKAWRKTMTIAAKESGTRPSNPIVGAVRVHATFSIIRPTTNKDDDPITTRTTADLDKLTRALFDSITDAGWWVDDVQVVSMNICKRWDVENGVAVVVEEL